MTAPGTGNSPSAVPRSPDVRYPADYRQSVSYSCTRTLPRPVAVGHHGPGIAKPREYRRESVAA
jgi:hypothetical protein